MKVVIMSKKTKNFIIFSVVYTLCYFISYLIQLNGLLTFTVSLFLAYFVVYLFNKNQ